MTPTVDERLASIIRSLTEVVLPHLPADASLAHEQVHLSIGHLQILRAQIDTSPTYEREELDDALKIAAALVGGLDGGVSTTSSLSHLDHMAKAADGSDVRGQAAAIYKAIDALVKAVSVDGSEGARAVLPSIILEHEAARTEKDRRWFLPFGFDTMDAVT